MSGLDFATYRFVLQPEETLSLPEYKGSTFRGAFGTVFRRVACMCGVDANEHQLHCFYSRVFETPRDEALTDLPQTMTAPHPFVLEPPLELQRIYTPDDQLVVHMLLIGQAIEWLPYFVFSFEELGRLGIGERRGKTRLLRVTCQPGLEELSIFEGESRQFLGSGQRVSIESFWSHDDAANAIDIAFLTPSRLVSKGQLRGSLDFPLIFGALLRRIALLMVAHGGGGTLRLPTGYEIDAGAILRYYFNRRAQHPEDRSAILEAFDLAAKITPIVQELRWHDWERYSNRQKTHMNFGGLMGHAKYVGELGPFMPYLRLGEVLHVGKNTAFGLGQMAVQIEL